MTGKELFNSMTPKQRQWHRARLINFANSMSHKYDDLAPYKIEQRQSEYHEPNKSVQVQKIYTKNSNYNKPYFVDNDLYLSPDDFIDSLERFEQENPDEPQSFDLFPAKVQEAWTEQFALARTLFAIVTKKFAATVSALRIASLLAIPYHNRRDSNQQFEKYDAVTTRKPTPYERKFQLYRFRIMRHVPALKFDFYINSLEKNRFSEGSFFSINSRNALIFMHLGACMLGSRIKPLETAINVQSLPGVEFDFVETCLYSKIFKEFKMESCCTDDRRIVEIAFLAGRNSKYLEVKKPDETFQDHPA